MYGTQLDFFPDGANANSTEKAFQFDIGSLIHVPAGFQVWVENSTSPTFTVTLYGRLRKERVSSAGYAPPWVTLATITNATAADSRLVLISLKCDEWKAVLSGYTGPGKVFALLSGENIGGNR